MAQLSDDCFAFSGGLLPLADMEQLIAARIAPVDGTEEVALRAAFGRVIARDIAAPLDLPSFDNSAVDGFAVRHADLAADGDSVLTVVHRVAAGDATAHAVGRGEAVRIFTGAPMPPDADTVVMQEDVRLDGARVIVPCGLSCGANRRHAGEDVHAGSIVLPAGRRLAAADLALAAAQGLTTLPVRRRVRVALFSTGNEVIEPGTPRPPHAIYDANRYLLLALLERLGAAVTDLGILRDEPAELRAALTAAAGAHDLVLTSGGVSTGEADYVRAAVEAVGRLVFWRIAIKPGRPVAMGVLAGSDGKAGAAFVGLPGNPGAVYVTFVRVVRPLLLRLMGATPHPLAARPVRAAFSYRKKKGRREYVRASLRAAPDGAIEACKFSREGTGIITSLTETDGLVELAETVTAVAPGDIVGFLSHAELTA